MEHPERTLPRALALSVFSVILCTGLPLLVAAGNDRFWRCWEEVTPTLTLTLATEPTLDPDPTPPRPLTLATV